MIRTTVYITSRGVRLNTHSIQKVCQAVFIEHPLDRSVLDLKGDRM